MARVVARVWVDQCRWMTDLIRQAVAVQAAPLPPEHIRWSRQASIDRADINGPRSGRLVLEHLLADMTPTDQPVDWLDIVRRAYRHAQDGGAPG